MRSRWQFICGAAAGPLFVLIFLIEGAQRPDYSSIRHPVSSLAYGESGWVQNANFIAAGSLSLVFALGLRHAFRGKGGTRWGPLLVAISALCLIATAFFLTDPFSGYPPGTPGHPLQYSLHGLLHTAVSTGSFITLTAACFVFAGFFTRENERGWMIYSYASGIGTLFFFFCAFLGMQQVAGFVEIGGLLQRMSIIISMSWHTLLALRLLRSPVLTRDVIISEEG